MSSRYSNNYYLRSHKRDQFIEFIKSLLLTPFILSSSGSAEQQNLDNKVISSNLDRYLDVLKHLETLIEDHRHISAQVFRLYCRHAWKLSDWNERDTHIGHDSSQSSRQSASFSRPFRLFRHSNW
eukprot:Partr_v1_DN25973_c1_g1_i2_m68481